MKTKNLKTMLNRKYPLRVIGCHNGLTAKLGENAGFDALWVSGFEISTSFALPDANFVSFKELLDIVSNISDSVNIPIIVDCDTGFGDQNNVAHIVRKLEKCGASAICMEDKKFPKTNSFHDKGHNMVTVDDFVKKIKSGIKNRNNRNFLIIARTEALILGLGMEETLKRAEAYADSGADMILVHSKSNSPTEVIDFTNKWKRKTPIVIVPTKYYDFQISRIRKLKKIRMVIYANHGLRTIVSSVNRTYKEILKSGSTKLIEKRIATIDDIFDIQGLKKLSK